MRAECFIVLCGGCWAGGQEIQICLWGLSVLQCAAVVCLYLSFPERKAEVGSCFLLQSTLRQAWKVLGGSSPYFWNNCLVQSSLFFFFSFSLLFFFFPPNFNPFWSKFNPFRSSQLILWSGKAECYRQLWLDCDLVWDLYMNLVMRYSMVNTHSQ